MSVSRREFIRTSGAVAIYFSLGATGCSAPGKADGHVTLGNRLAVNSDGTVDFFMGKVELGQGIGTALAQIAAEELGVAVQRIRLVPVDTTLSPDESYTFSSISVQQSGPQVRNAAATGRQYLLQRAAAKLNTDASELSVVDGQIMQGQRATTLDYWTILDDGSETVELDGNVVPAIDKNYRVIGTSVQRIDIPGKVFADESYIQDVRLPDMVHARVVRPPADRATLTGFDSQPVASMPGVLKVVSDGNFVGVIAEREGQARKAARRLTGLLKWETTDDLPESATFYQWLSSAESRLEPVAERGSVNIPATGKNVVRATYQRPYQAHASISPSAALALFDGTNLTVWSHAQGMYPLREAIAHVLELPIEQVRCIHREASGCYGHNGADDAACDAAALALQVPGVPIRLQWERGDEFAWEPFGPGMTIDVEAVLGDDGLITDWQYDLWSCPHASRPRAAASAGHLLYAQHKENPLPVPPPHSIPQPNGGADRNAVPLYAFDNLQVNKHLVTDIPLRGSSLRSLGAYGNVFAIDSFMDELASVTRTDPFDFRIRHLEDQRAIAVLRHLREVSNWSERPKAGTGVGWGLGFAQFKNLSSYMGVVMRLQVDSATGAIRLTEAIAVCDAGLIINPDGVKAQIEGGIVQSSSWTMKEEVRLSPQRIESRDWNSYPILRFDEVPDIQVHLIARPDQASLGVGETAQGPTAAAIANAVFHASGHRVRRLPLSANLAKS